MVPRGIAHVSKINEKWIRNDHKLICQNNTQKVVNMAPELVQNGAQVGSKIDEQWVARGT